ncbi:MAG: winged helix-turn-helix domain-containing protein [Oscillospiraceae bacterium]
MADGVVTYKGASAELTKNESRILSVLLERRGEIVSRSELMNRLWETDCFVDENTLTVNVTRLRRRLEEIGAENVVKTRKGIGYIIE